MLVAKINPPAKRIVQTTPFSQTELTGEYMLARCTQLNIDPTPNTPTDEIIFMVRFGSVKYYQNPDGSNGDPVFDVVISARVVFTSAELSDWGTDDTIVYQKIATKLGFSILSTENLPISNN